MGDDITTTVVADCEIEPGLRDAALAICWATFGSRFSEDDADHTAGGVRLLVYDAGLLVGHAAVVPRRIEIEGRVLAAGYVEGVAVLPEHQGRGLGSRLVRATNAVIERDAFELGVLSTSRHGVYERAGWRRWQGPSYVRHPDRVERTPGEDAGLMALLLPGTAGVDLTGSITCDTRPGDDW